jgi:hypothetical protein
LVDNCSIHLDRAVRRRSTQQSREAYREVHNEAGSRSPRARTRRIGRVGGLTAGLLLLAGVGCAGPLSVGDEASPPDGLPLAITPDTCGSVPDSDEDSISDTCETVLAAAFAPSLVVAPSTCDWDDTVSPSRLGGGYYYAVAPSVGGEGIRIAYMPAYYRDCGWFGPKCGIPGVDCAPHAGDSEAVMVDVEYDQDIGQWRTTGIFLSAHCFGSSSDGCRWYRGSRLRQFAWVAGVVRGAPIVWVSEGRHANYPTRTSCDRGHYWLDTCDRNRYAFRFPIRHTRQNVGSRAVPFGSSATELRVPRMAGTPDTGALRAGDASGCVDDLHATWNSEWTVRGAFECFWVAVPFRGWQLEGPGVTPYETYLTTIAGF